MARTRIKICGITRPEDASMATELGANAIGLNFSPPSPRFISIDQAKQIIAVLPPFTTKVALFVDATVAEVEKTLSLISIDLLQFHGQESESFCKQFNKPYVKAIHVKPNLNLVEAIAQYSSACGILLDTYQKDLPGGTGKAFDWSLIPSNLKKPLILAGGLNAGNVALAIASVKPYAVDVSSGVESSPGIKDHAKLKAFISAVLQA